MPPGFRPSPPTFWDRDGAAARLLSPLGRLYAAEAARRTAAARPARAGVPVVCVGNVSTGGVGKTPFALLVARLMEAAGGSPGFLTRGYGGSVAGPHRVRGDDGAADVGDEALLLARAAPCWVSRDRVAGAAAAVRAGVDAIVMDDGFQNPSLRKDLSFLLIDAERGLGNGRVLPAGPLRERPVAAFGRADAVVLVGAGRDERVRAEAARRAQGLPLLTASLAIDVPAALKGRPVHAVAGIGRPERFFAALRRAGVEVARELPRPDHHPFGRSEVARLAARAAEAGAVLVATEKDRARANEADRARMVAVPARMTSDDEDAIGRLLAGVMGGGSVD